LAKILLAGEFFVLKMHDFLPPALENQGFSVSTKKVKTSTVECGLRASAGGFHFLS